MELLIPAAGVPAVPITLQFSRLPTAAHFSHTTILYFKNTPLISSNHSFPKLAFISRTTPISARASALFDSPAAAPAAFAAASPSTRWMVAMEKPPDAEASSRAEIIDYYVRTLARVLPSEKEAQMCIYRASWEREFVFFCDIDADVSRLFASVPEVISVRPDSDMETAVTDSSTPNIIDKKSSLDNHASRFSPPVTDCDYWLVKMEKPGVEVVTKAQMVDYFAQALTKVLGNESDAQVSIYNISWERDFGFCCQIDEECARELSDVPAVISVQPDVNFDPDKKNYKAGDTSLKTEETHASTNTSSLPNVRSKRLFLTGVPEVISIRPDSDMETAVTNSSTTNILDKKSSPDTHDSKFSPPATNCEYWLVKMEKPGVEVVTKAQMVDYFAQALTKVLGNEKDAQVSIYNISWEMDFGFCCQIDEECARELSDVPGVLAVQPDMKFDSDKKNYKAGDASLQTEEMHDSTNTSSVPDVRTKRLFVTGLSFYTSEKTLRASFEPFGELVEVKIIMDKISKRSKGYAFLEYTTEEAAGAALKEMNGKIINGWMIVVDVARTNPPRSTWGIRDHRLARHHWGY